MVYANPVWGAPESLTAEVIDRTRELLRTAERPILLHCKSANRVGAAWLAYRVLDDGATVEESAAEAATVGLRTPAYGERVERYIAEERQGVEGGER